MTKEEKINKVARDFSTLPEDKQDYILGILQALVFANDEGKEKIDSNSPATKFDGTWKMA
jgi:hypothetical protein